ncbi:MAG: phosphoenolpyruvate--protein phosphotransferase [Enterocloster asparagiformis]|nr:phosphoenolpyruvate--protein phosphotransferase [Enterocloster asparagiformis]
MVTHQGNPVSKGVAVGRVYKYVPYQAAVEETNIRPEQVEAEMAAYRAAKERAAAELAAMGEALGDADSDKAAILGAHREILADPALDEMVSGLIRDEYYNVKWAVERAFAKFIKMLSRVKDDMIRERIADMKDVRGRLLRGCDGVAEVNLGALTEPVIVVAQDLFPSDTASLKRDMVQAIVTEVGGATSHTAIIARSYEIPALLGVGGAMDLLEDGQIVGVDAIDGVLATDLSAPEIAALEDKARAYRVHAEETRKYQGVEPVTGDGVRIEVELNIGSASPEELEGACCTDGVGLFRSEFLYMGRDTLPGEDEQTEIYSRVLKAFEGRPVTLRTLDIGGDKKLDCLELPKEENPFLGNRALRLCFTYPDIFKTQLRAALRAAVDGDLWVMFPMVGSMDDIRRAKAAVQEAREELRAEGKPCGDIKIGIMIEIPSIALIADLAVREVDFASIGTNDLCQYATAVDRMNPAVSQYYQKYHPAMFRLIRGVVETFNKAGKPICVCGELGGDELAAAVLVGLGMRRLSMGRACVAQTKKMITNMTVGRAREMALKVCDMETADEIQAYLTNELRDIL